MGKSSVQTGSFIDIGKRKMQEDSLLVSPPGRFSLGSKERFIGVVADGMGGLKNGMEASARAVQRLYEDFEEIRGQRDVEPSKFLQEEIYQINMMVFAMSRKMEAGTTLSAVIIEDNIMHMVSVGDSRIYLLRDNVLYLLTREHNFKLVLKKALKRGRITREVYDDTQSKDALVSYIGMKDLRYVDVTEEGFPLKNGDVILICSDGLVKTLKDEEIENILNAEKNDMVRAAETLGLYTLSKEKKNQDNEAIVLMKYSES